MIIEISEEERSFLQEALEWGKIGYEEKSAKYQSMEGYNENIYQPKLAMFKGLLEKLHKKINGNSAVGI